MSPCGAERSSTMSESTNSVAKMATTPTTNQLMVVENPEMPVIKNERSQEITKRLKNIMTKLDCWGNKIARGLWRLVMMGIVLHVAEYFAPELRQHIPMLYQIVDGGMMLMNFTFEWGLKLITAIFTGKVLEVNPEFQHAVRELITTFTTWMTSI